MILKYSKKYVKFKFKQKNNIIWKNFIRADDNLIR